jgi:hypothetical protein
MNYKYILKSFILVSIVLVAMTAQAMEFTVTDEDDDSQFNYVVANDQIIENDHTSLRLILDRQFRMKRRWVILLTSQGGELEEVDDLAREIVKQANRFYLITGKTNLFYVNTLCGSACTVLTSALTKLRNPKSLEIIADSDAKFLFHSPVLCDDGKISEYKDLRTKKAAVEFMLNSYKSYGVSSKWIEINLGMFEDWRFTTKTAQEVCKAAVGVLPTNACISNNNRDVVNERIQKVMDSGKRFF